MFLVVFVFLYWIRPWIYLCACLASGELGCLKKAERCRDIVGRSSHRSFKPSLSTEEGLMSAIHHCTVHTHIYIRLVWPVDCHDSHPCTIMRVVFLGVS